MLTYLDVLAAALAARDAAEIRRLLDHPMARLLPADARAEAEGIADGSLGVQVVPMRVLLFRRLTAALIAAAEPEVVLPAAPEQPDAASTSVEPPTRTETARVIVPAPTRRRRRRDQMELPLSA